MRTAAPGRESEAERVRSLLDAVLREDVAGVRTRGRLTRSALLVVGRLQIPVRPARPGDLVADLVARRPWVQVVRRARVVRHRRLLAVLNALRAELPDADLTTGFGLLRAEARAALIADRLRARSRATVLPEALHRDDYETVAAYGEHPFHPLVTARVGLSAGQLVGTAPEHAPVVVPGWLVVPGARARGRLPDWWPTADGVPAVPVHPVTDPASLPLPDGTRWLEAGIAGRPTLSIRTLDLLDHPGAHLKLPIPVRTLGRRSARRLARAGLADAATMHGLLTSVLAAETGWAERVAIADESTWVWAGDPMLAGVLRRVPVTPGQVLLPVAAMAVPGVARSLADRFHDRDLTGLLREYLRTLLGWHLTLWLRHGVVLEAHQQNVALTVGPAGIGLLMRDLDSARVLAGHQLDRRFEDPRTVTADPAELADLLVTTTLHQCAAAVLVAVARAEKILPATLLALLPAALAEARAGLSATLDEAALAPLDRLRTARRLPVKCLLTATTLLPPERTGAADVTKYYPTDGPSYLQPLVEDGFDADRATLHALVRCLAREVAGPAGRATLRAGRLHLDLGERGRLEVAARGLGAGVARPHGPVLLTPPGETGRRVTWRELAELTENALAATEPGAGGLAVQVRQSHALMAAARPGAGSNRQDRFLAAEQSLRAGHGNHPAPKARGEDAAEALRFAPEAGASFPLHYLAVRTDAAWTRTHRPLIDDLVAGDIDCPPGYLVLPVHPWQRIRLRRDRVTGAALTGALRDGRLVDLGPGRRPWWPTASVRTLTRPDVPGFLKLALGVRITNCVRLNPRPELDAAVRLSERLAPLIADLARHCPGTIVLLEPEGRTVADPALADHLGVLARQGLPPSTGVHRPAFPAAALCEPVPSPWLADLLDRITAEEDRLVAWWRAYLGLLLPPVWRSLVRHGVVFEAHLQNVVVRLGPDDAPAGLAMRDLEGAKVAPGLVPPGPAWVRELPVDVAAHLVYPPGRAWCRAAYCLLVNHVATVLGALADRAAAGPELEGRLWAEVRLVLRTCRERDGDLPGEPLAAVLAGAPVPAKANLLTRWHDRADRDSGYVPVHLPLGPVATPSPLRAPALVR